MLVQICDSDSHEVVYSHTLSDKHNGMFTVQHYSCVNTMYLQHTLKALLVYPILYLLVRT